MKTKQVFFFILALGLSLSLAFAAGTPAGTEISNQATGTYYDINGNLRPEVQSNTVTTTVSQVAGVDLAPESQSRDILFGGTEVFSLTLTNGGNEEDKFIIELSYDEAGGAKNTAKIYSNPNNDPAYIEGTHVELQKEDGKYKTPLVGHTPTTEKFHMFVVVENTEGAPRSTNDISIEATSEYSVEEVEPVSAVATITTTVLRPKINTSFSVDPTSAIPEEDVVEFTFSIENTGNAIASHFEATIVFPDGITYAPGSTMLYVGEEVEIDIDDGNESSILGEGDPEMIIYVTSSSIEIYIEKFDYDDGLEDSYYGKITYEAKVKNNVEFGTVIENEVSGSYTNETEVLEEDFSETAELTVKKSIGVAFEDGSDPEDFYTPKDTVIYTVTLTNNGNATYTFNITHNDDSSWVWKIYDSENNVIVNPIEIEAFESVDLTVASRVPVGTSDEATNVLTLTATNTEDPSDKATTTFTVKVAAPVLALNKSVSPTDDQPPGTVLTYTLTVTNTGSGKAETILITDPIPENTTYEEDSMCMRTGLLGEWTDLTDDADEDAGTLSGDNVVFSLPELAAQTIVQFSFQVKIK